MERPSRDVSGRALRLIDMWVGAGEIVIDLAPLRGVNVKFVEAFWGDPSDVGGFVVG